MSTATDNMEKDANKNEDEEENEMGELDFRRPSIYLVDYRYRIHWQCHTYHSSWNSFYSRNSLNVIIFV